MPDCFALDHICAYCGFYGFKPDNPDGPGQAFCTFFKKYFPDQLNPKRTPAGMRGEKCKHWTHMGEKAGNKEGLYDEDQ